GRRAGRGRGLPPRAPSRRPCPPRARRAPKYPPTAPAPWTRMRTSLRRLSAAEIDLRRLLGLGRRLEVLLRLEAEAPGVERRREALDVRVVLADNVVVPHALHRDPVLGARELVREPRELLVRLEIGVALGDRQEAPEGRRHLVPGGDALLAPAAR